MPRGMKLTGTNRSIGLIVPQLNPCVAKKPPCGLCIQTVSSHSAFPDRPCDWIRNAVLNYIPLVDPVILPEGPHPIPFRTRSLSLPGPMVLRLKARESRSSPGLQDGCFQDQKPFIHNRFAAGWSSPVARQAHNLKVTGSNPVPAPKQTNAPGLTVGGFCVSGSPFATSLISDEPFSRSSPEDRVRRTYDGLDRVAN